MSAAASPLFLLDLQEATWPAATRETVETVWAARFTEGAGRRVSSARPMALDAAALITALPAVEARYDDRDLPALLQLPDAVDEALEVALASRGYTPIAPTRFLEADVAPVAAEPLRNKAFPYLIRVATPLKLVAELWDHGGIGAARRDVMDRVALGQIWTIRLDNRIAGAAFIGGGPDPAAPEAAMLHALSVAPWARRRGLGTDLVIGCARWAERVGARRFVIDVDADNTSALTLYQALGFCDIGGYRYWRGST